MKTFYGGGFKVTYDDSENMKNKVFDAVINWFIKHDMYSGESIMQMDEPQLDAPLFMSDLADDIIQFEVDWE